MADLKNVSDDILARRGREFVRRGQFALGNEFLSEYCTRAMEQEKGISGVILASYGLAVGMTTDLKEGIEICHRALNSDRRNPEIYLSIARLQVQAGSRKKAVEAIERGLSFSSKHRELLALQKQIGQRQQPLVPFLPRNSPVNVKLGRLFHKLRTANQVKSGNRPKSKAGVTA
jgi:hypothetical protein